MFAPNKGPLSGCYVVYMDRIFCSEMFVTRALVDRARWYTEQVWKVICRGQGLLDTTTVQNRKSSGYYKDNLGDFYSFLIMFAVFV